MSIQKKATSAMKPVTGNVALSMASHSTSVENKPTPCESIGYNFDPIILRESDIRGIVGENLSDIDAYHIGRSFGSVIRLCGGNTVCVGYDGRLTSPALSAALIDGLRHSGMTIFEIGLGPSPMLYYAAHKMASHGAIMVTGSHNPSEYNGFKMMLGTNSFHGADIQRLGMIASKGVFASGKGKVIKRPMFRSYVNRLLKETSRLSSLNVAWDAGNGAAGQVIEQVTSKLPGRHILLNCEIDGTFPAHHPDPTVPENLTQLIDTVRREECDLGIAFDGDGDRLGVVDANGQILWGDQLMILFSRDVLKTTPGATIIADVKASQSLFDAITDMGGEALMWKTGHSLIKSKMVETDAPLAGEMSGHIFFADRYYGFDDAVYAALRLLNILSEHSGDITELFKSLPHPINTPELRFECAEEDKKRIVSEVNERLQSSNANVNTVDGVRVQTDDGWWLLRASNTQAVLVARCESDSQQGLDRLYENLTEQLNLSGYSGTLPPY